MFETLDTLLKVFILNGFTLLSIVLIIASIFLSGIVCGVLINRHFGTQPFWAENAKIARIDCPFFKKANASDHKCLMLEKRL